MNKLTGKQILRNIQISILTDNLGEYKSLYNDLNSMFDNLTVYKYNISGFRKDLYYVNDKGEIIIHYENHRSVIWLNRTKVISYIEIKHKLSVDVVHDAVHFYLERLLDIKASCIGETVTNGTINSDSINFIKL